LFDDLSSEARRILDAVPGLVEKTFPLPARFRKSLPRGIAELSRFLTSGRGERGTSYLGKPDLLSAYLRYFLPWNLYRLCRLLPSLPLSLAEGDAVTDLGSGPLTFPAALWISRPDLRNVPLEFRCLDRTPAVLDAGKRFFAALTEHSAGSSGAGSLWKTRTIPETLGVPVHGKPAALVSAVNFLNELYQDIPHTSRRGLERAAHLYAGIIDRLAGGAVLVVEPGTPRSGEFISCMRDALAEKGKFPLSPCPHTGPCPFPGGKGGRWCHFAFDTEHAPAALHKLSAAAGIPKERAVLSFLFSGPENPKPAAELVRVISDLFPVKPTGRAGSYGRYGCSLKGPVLIRGERPFMETLVSGSLFAPPLEASGERDKKSGALIVSGERISLQ
jgi:hypothetical protein